ncbi:UreF-domain-containing protein [Xylariomycetidae sp. FL0641]|nr:UreF-domain-containing protein [Xylariomycetidae sp. FL0641]
MMSVAAPEGSQQETEREIADLEARLAAAKQRLRSQQGHSSPPPAPAAAASAPNPRTEGLLTNTSAQHHLLLLSDSALPLGSFAFSSGLESYLAHSRAAPRPPSTTAAPPPSFASFLPLSLSSYASTALPFALSAHRAPTSARVAALDDALDAAVVCAVGRRASVAQGRALLGVWEKSLGAAAACGAPGTRAALRPFAELLRRSAAGAEGDDEDEPVPRVSAHLPPLFGCVAALLGLTAPQTAYVFLLSHAKALVSAAVRAGVFGPFQAQRILAGAALPALIDELVAREWDTRIEEAGQSVPVIDLWIGRHEMLYSRIFNS